MKNLIEYIVEYTMRDVLFEQNNRQVRHLLTFRLIRNIDSLPLYQNDRILINGYKVVCNETNNTPETIDKNELHVDILWPTGVDIQSRYSILNK